MTKELRQQIYNKYNGHCAYCGCEIEYKEMQIDHIIPKLFGGSNEIGNLNPSCRACNFYKGTFTIEEFRERVRSLRHGLLKIFIVKLALKYGILTYTSFDEKFYFEKLLEEK